MQGDPSGLRRLLDSGVVKGRRLTRTAAPDGTVAGLRDRLGFGAVDADRRLPPATARIRVVPHHDRRGGPPAFGISAWCEGVARLPYTTGPTQLRPDGIALGNVRAGGEAPSELLRAIRLWSRNQRVLAAWINRARAVHGDALRLTIHDDTGYELPWEALWLPSDHGHGLTEGLLGALVVLTRWLTIRRPDIVLPKDHTAVEGGVLGYFFHDRDFDPLLEPSRAHLHDMRSDMAAFHGYVHRPHVDIDPFLAALDEPSGLPTGLVYMACHGTYDEQVSALSLAGVTWSELDEHEMAVLDSDHAMVCLNACHSGRFVRNTGGGESDLRGFAELFLRKGAAGCVVTAGKVGDREARELIGQLVRTVTEEPWRPVADSLRLFRARALQEFGSLADIPRTQQEGRPNREGQRRVRRLLYSLMFQYYGHPLSTLRLAGLRDDAAGTKRREEAHHYER
ncbi:CHAT domain-containing protein [Streptomyces sp. NPDC058231]|uniref:CHAT domain-containing protein n=1 Tax=Streptomyces sp. NPDC058231 TaxID=3346392 RepID=UPI0036E789F1